jgi:hypothetical protein
VLCIVDESARHGILFDNCAEPRKIRWGLEKGLTCSSIPLGMLSRLNRFCHLQGSVNRPSRCRRRAELHCAPKVQAVCGPIPSMINGQSLVVPLRSHSLRFVLLRCSLQFFETASVQRLLRVAEREGNYDYMNFALSLQSQKFC